LEVLHTSSCNDLGVLPIRHYTIDRSHGGLRARYVRPSPRSRCPQARLRISVPAKQGIAMCLYLFKNQNSIRRASLEALRAFSCNDLGVLPIRHQFRSSVEGLFGNQRRGEAFQYKCNAICKPSVENASPLPVISTTVMGKKEAFGQFACSVPRGDFAPRTPARSIV